MIRLGDEVDLTALPIPTYCELDGGPFITLGIAISKDPEDGGKNASIYRHQLLTNAAWEYYHHRPITWACITKKPKRWVNRWSLRLRWGLPPVH